MKKNIRLEAMLIHKHRDIKLDQGIDIFYAPNKSINILIVTNKHILSYKYYLLLLYTNNKKNKLSKLEFVGFLATTDTADSPQIAALIRKIKVHTHHNATHNKEH